MKKLFQDEHILEDRENNPLVNDIYTNRPNYLIEMDDSQSENICAIYFSSNGLYTRDTIEEFTRVVINKDRFEWKNNRIKKAKKHIFLRDVYKDAYIRGINNELNSLHKVIEFLKTETQGYRIITLGSSSGGYAALVAGVVLNAEYIFSFTGQFSMWHHNIQHPYDFERESLFYKYRNDPEYNQYYNILESLMLDCNIPVFYFSSQVRLDITQRYLVQSHDNIFTFNMQSDNHRLPVYVFNFKDIINMDKMDLLKLGYKYCDKKVSRFRFSCDVTGFCKTVKLLAKEKFKSVKSSLFD